MSETVEKETSVLETIEEEKEEIEQNLETKSPEEETKSQKKEKNPNRVKAAHKLAAKRQLLKEESVRKRAQDEMTKPSTWVMVGVVLTSIGFLGLYFSPLFPKEEKQVLKDLGDTSPEPKKESIPKSYFG